MPATAREAVNHPLRRVVAKAYLDFAPMDPEYSNAGASPESWALWNHEIEGSLGVALGETAAADSSKWPEGYGIQAENECDSRVSFRHASK